VLLDELGAGTDPEEGSALARAILATLVEMRVTTLCAAHYPQLKAFAHNTAGVRNASVEFDLASLRPTYHLSIGLPGRSNALAIADRLGLPRPVIERARGKVDPQALRAEGLLDEIHRQREEARQARREADAVRLQAEAQPAELGRGRGGSRDGWGRRRLKSGPTGCGCGLRPEPCPRREPPSPSDRNRRAPPRCGCGRRRSP